MTINFWVKGLWINNRDIIRNYQGGSLRLRYWKWRVCDGRVTRIDNVNGIKGPLDTVVGGGGFLKFCKTEQRLGVVIRRFAQSRD